MNSIPDPEHRKCKSCKNTLPISAFATKPNGEYYVLCEVCREKQRLHYQENKERILEAQKQYHEEHREERLESMKRYSAEHKTEKAEYDRQYRAEHKEEIAEYKKNWREERLEEERERSRKYAREHKAEKAEYMRNYYQEHKSDLLEYMRCYYEEHKEEILAYNRRYWKERKEDKAIYTAARRAKKKGVGGKYTVGDLMGLYILQAGCCCWCGRQMVNRLIFKGSPVSVNFTIDHIKAIQDGGSNFPHNLVLACASCNFSKHNKKVFIEWQPSNMLEWMRDYVQRALEIENR